MNYNEVIEELSQSLLQKFKEVYRHVEIIRPEKEYFPVVSNNWEPKLSPTDQKETLYIRRNGDDEVVEELKLSSCVKSYKMRSSLRVVYFKDNAKDQNQILSNLMYSVLIAGTKLRSIIRDKWKLLKDESSGDYNFKPTTAYFAIDIYALWELKTDTCEEICIEIINPLCKI